MSEVHNNLASEPIVIVENDDLKNLGSPYPMVVVLEMFKKLSVGQVAIMAQQQTFLARVDALSSLHGETLGSRQSVDFSSHFRDTNPPEYTVGG